MTEKQNCMYRKSDQKDCKAIYELICDLEETKLSYDRFSEIYSRQVCDDRYYCLLCEENNSVIGVLNIRFEEQLHHAERIAEILEFAVNKDYRSRGIGKEMLAKACSIAENKGCLQIEAASSRRRRAAHRFYEREGMQNNHFKYSKRLNQAE